MCDQETCCKTEQKGLAQGLHQVSALLVEKLIHLCFARGKASVMQVSKEEGSNEESEAAGGQTIGTLECTLKWYFKARNRKLFYLQFSIAFKRRKK